jgi:hypothetical protein
MMQRLPGREPMSEEGFFDADERRWTRIRPDHLDLSAFIRVHLRQKFFA